MIIVQDRDLGDEEPMSWYAYEQIAYEQERRRLEDEAFVRGTRGEQHFINVDLDDGLQMDWDDES